MNNETIVENYEITGKIYRDSRIPSAFTGKKCKLDRYFKEREGKDGSKYLHILLEPDPEVKLHRELKYAVPGKILVCLFGNKIYDFLDQLEKNIISEGDRVYIKGDIKKNTTYYLSVVVSNKDTMFRIGD